METVLHGPRDGEGPVPRLGPVGRVAVLSDVHANVAALAAVLDEPDVRAADLVVFCGDLILTPGTSAERLAEVRVRFGFAEPTLVSGHSHVQFDRTVDGLRSVNPGSVGLPYHDGEPGTAYWALLGPDVRLRRTRYDVAAAIERCHAVGDPAAERIAGLLMAPPAVAGLIAHAEALRFSD
ncbi:metallophosphoesterase family protein [Dactylosporangium matsuzakiense]|uniref:Calcineurin-like phosphoesterase domain-containing protein n=1 Tax=Dactylosporangium matsuzakiense TaxID=53360 RepID=A0A9W6KUU4_9ACTN|nr:metallophosphatase family protein [Dactylosporangium matsuzakiense]UWZ48334.1 metallophosphoesterase family protein [Dactylosporangium matsuzakiense]GLL07627.1 hypothetical protein GCM10017581_093810 [Dactylosporangium matsuzakiense]